MPKYVPIIVTIGGSADVDAALGKMTDIFKKMDEESKKAADSANAARDAARKAAKERADAEREAGKITADAYRDAMISANLYFQLIKEGISWIRNITTETIQYAARTEQLNYSIDALAKASNSSTTALQAQVLAIHSMGVATQFALQLLNKMAVAELDTADATKLVTVAQNLSVVAGISVNEEMDKLIRGIVTQQPRILRTAGVFLQIKDVLGELSRETGRATASFSEAEKQQALMNAVIEYGARVTGVYDKSMKGALTALNELDRAQGDFKNSFGDLFLGDYVKGIKTTTMLYDVLARYPKTILTIIEAIIALGLAFIFLNTTVVPNFISKIAFMIEGLVNLTRVMRGAETTAIATGTALGALAAAAALVTAAFFALIAGLEFYKEWKENATKVIEINQSTLQSILVKTNAQEKDADSLARLQPILKTTIENMSKLRAEYAGLNEKIAEEEALKKQIGVFGGGGGFTDPERLKETGVAVLAGLGDWLTIGKKLYGIPSLTGAYKDSVTHDHEQKLSDDQSKLAAGLQNDPAWKIQSQNLADVAIRYNLTAQAVYQYGTGVKNVTAIDRENIKAVQDMITAKIAEKDAWKSVEEGIKGYVKTVEEAAPKPVDETISTAYIRALSTATEKALWNRADELAQGGKGSNGNAINEGLITQRQRDIEVAGGYAQTLIKIDSLLKKTSVSQADYNLKFSQLPNLVQQYIHILAQRKVEEASIITVSEKENEIAKRQIELNLSLQHSKEAIAALSQGGSDNDKLDLQAIAAKKIADSMKEVFILENQIGISRGPIPDDLPSLEKRLFIDRQLEGAKTNILKSTYSQFEAEVKLTESIAQSWQPVVDAETRAAKAFVDYINKQRDAEQQLTADIAVELEKRAHFAMTLNKQIAITQAEVFLDHAKQESKAKSDILKDFAEAAYQSGDRFKYNTLINQAKQDSTVTITGLISGTNSILSEGVVGTLRDILAAVGGSSTHGDGATRARTTGHKDGDVNMSLGARERDYSTGLNVDFKGITGITYDELDTLFRTNEGHALAISKAFHTFMEDMKNAKITLEEAGANAELRARNIAAIIQANKDKAKSDLNTAVTSGNPIAIAGAQNSLNNLQNNDPNTILSIQQHIQQSRIESVAATLAQLKALQEQEKMGFHNSIEYQSQLANKFEISRREGRQTTIDNIKKLEDDLKHVDDNNALDYKEVWLKAQIEVAQGHRKAVEAQIKAQSELADKMSYDADDVRGRILTKMAADTKSINDMMADAYTGTIGAITSTLDTQLSKITAKMGAFGGVIKGVLEDIAKLALNRVFTRLLDTILPPTQSGTQAGGGMPQGGQKGNQQSGGVLGSISSIAQNIFSGDGSSSGGGMGEITAPGGLGAVLTNFSSGGGIPPTGGFSTIGNQQPWSESIPGITDGSSAASSSSGSGVGGAIQQALGGGGQSGKSGGGVGGIVSGLLGKGAGMLGGLFGGGGGALGGSMGAAGANAAMDSMGAASGAALDGTLAAGGAAAGGLAGGGLSSLLMGAAGGPIGLAIAGAAIAIPLIIGLFSNGTEKAIRAAIKADPKWMLDIKDMKTLTQIKQIGEQSVGVGNVGKGNNIQSTIHLPEVEQMLAAYGVSTGQMNSPGVKAFQLTNASNAANQYSSNSAIPGLPKFDQGTNFVPYDMDARIHKGEAIVPASQNKGGSGGMSDKLEAMIESLHARLDSMSPGDVLHLGAKQNPTAVVDGMVNGLSQSGDGVQNMNRALGFAR